MVVRLLGVHHMTGNTCDILEAFAALCLHQPHTEAIAGGSSTVPPWCCTAAGLPSFLQQLVPHLRLIVCGVCVCCVCMLQAMLEQEARLGGFKAELIQKQDMHLATLQKDLDRQQNFLDKTRSEVRHEIDKLTASQRLDLNLEKG